MGVLCKEYHVRVITYSDHTECDGLVNLLVDSLDHIYDKMPIKVT